MNRSRMAWGLAAAALACAACATIEPAEPAWIASWGTAVTAPSPGFGPFPATPSFEDRTIRQVVRLSAGGDQVRVRFSNEYGAAPLAIGAARVALVDADGAIAPGTERTLTFSGAPTAMIPPGAPLVSDPVDLAFEDLASLSISAYFPGDTGPCTCHMVGLETGFVSEPGDHTNEVFAPAETIEMRAFLSGVEVHAPSGGTTIVAFGDSITDGVGSTSGANLRWPDILAERLAVREDGGHAWGVANVGISGNRVLGPGAGDAALARFDRDALARPGVGYVILFEGVNDLGVGLGSLPGAPPPAGLRLRASDVIAGYEQLIDRAHASGVKVIGATIAPYEGAFYYSADGEAARQEINAWIRESGRFDAVLDFDAALADPAQPSRMADGLHAGDFLHGSDAGYRALADSIDLDIFR